MAAITYTKWITQLEEIAKPWKEFGLLKHIKNPYHATCVGALLENQRLINEAVNRDRDEIGQFKRISIPLVLRVFSSAAFLNWVGFQPSRGPADYLWIERDGSMPSWMENQSSFVCRTKFLSTRWPQAKFHESLKSLDREVDITAVLATQMADELSREVIKDLKDHGTKAVKNIEGDQREEIRKVFDHVDVSLRKSLAFAPSWLITTPKLLGLLRQDPALNFVEEEDEHYELQVRKVGQIQGYIDVYCDHGELPTLAENQIIFGGKRGNHEAGYYYMPYVPMTLTALEDGRADAGILSRYAKKMTTDGRHFYRVVTLNNLDFSSLVKNHVEILDEPGEEVENVLSQEQDLSEEAGEE